MNLKKLPSSVLDQKKPRFKTNYEIDDHLLSLASLSSRYGTSLSSLSPQSSLGLSSSEIPALQLLHGRNHLSPPRTIPEWRKFLHHLFDLFNILLFIGGSLSFIAYALDPSDSSTIYLGCFLIFIVIFDAVIGYLQERSSSNVMGKFKGMLPPSCTVIRSGTEQQIPAEDVVLGDLIRIQAGNKIPADLRIIHNSGLKVEQSALNGESEPVEVAEQGLSNNFMDSRNIVFNGCLCLEGSAYGVAIKIGDNTYLGIIAQQTAQIESVETPLQKEIKRFVKFITILGITLGTIVFSIGAARGASSFLDLFVQGFIIVIIANIPQGLPATVVSCLTIIAYRMSKQNVYIKKLESIETLGSATVIASDKTGTLTMNQMTVEHLWLDCQIYSAEFVAQNHQDFKKNKTWRQLFNIGVLCNKAFFQENKENSQNIEKNEDFQKIAKNEDFQKIAKNEDFQKIAKNEDFEKIAKNEDFAKKHDFSQNQDFITDLEKNDNFEKKLLGASVRRSDAEEDSRTSNRNSPASRSLIRRLSQVPNKDSSEIPAENSSEMTKALKNQQALEMAKFREAERKTEDRKKMAIIGDATETAILRYCELFKRTDNFRERHRKIFELPFNSKNKYQVSVHQSKESRILVMKGAPEIIFAKSAFFLKNGKPHKISTEFQEDFQSAYELLGRKGERVIGCSYVDLGKDATSEYSLQSDNIPLERLCFVGLFSLMDPPKKGVADAVRKARKAGIKVFMITGDHPLTAEAVARKVNIIGEYETIEEIAAKKKCAKEALDPNIALAGVVSGSELSVYSENDWKALILSKRELVFARISPQQKVEIVENLQKMKEVVIVTGDGVNDAIALKKADIGVAMGRGGTDVAKEAAEVIFIDDNFESIVSGIKEGRTLFDNLKKTIVYTLTHCILELAPILLNVSVGLPLGKFINN